MALKFTLDMISAIAKGKRNWESVVELNQRIISIDNQNSFVYHEIAIAYEQLKDPESSLESAKLAFAIDPKSFLTLQLLTRLYSQLKNNERTYEFAKLSLENIPEAGPPPSKKLLKVLRLFSMIPIINTIHMQLSKKRANWGSWRNDWIKWANHYVAWYETNKAEPN